MAEPRTTTEILKDLTSNLQTLVRKELELARVELQEGVQKQLMAAGLFAAAGVLALFVLAFLGVTGAVALQNVVVPWVAWLIVTVVFAVLMTIAILVARSLVGEASLTPEQTKTSIEETSAWAKQQIGR